MVVSSSPGEGPNTQRDFTAVIDAFNEAEGDGDIERIVADQRLTPDDLDAMMTAAREDIATRMEQYDREARLPPSFSIVTINSIARLFGRKGDLIPPPRRYRFGLHHSEHGPAVDRLNNAIFATERAMQKYLRPHLPKGYAGGGIGGVIEYRDDVIRYDRPISLLLAKLPHLKRELGIGEEDAMDVCRGKLLSSLRGAANPIQIHPSGRVIDGNTRLLYGKMLEIDEWDLPVHVIARGDCMLADVKEDLRKNAHR